ncbi:MAG: LLM class flavin-dependent oxidoreductase [Acidimicrobiales bacterium]
MTAWALTSLGDHLPDPKTGAQMSQGDRHRQIIDLAVEAEHLGARSVHIGEHHFCDYIVSSPVLVLTAIAGLTERLRLSTAVTLLAHPDPVAIAEQWATLDVLSAGRAEMIVGRGVVPALYEQYGQDHADSRQLVADNIELLRLLWSGDEVTWRGDFRAGLDGVTLAPRPVQLGGPPIWVSVSSSESVAEAVRFGSPAAIPLVSTGFDRGAELVQEYRHRWAEVGRPAEDAVAAVNIHCHVSERSDAREYWAPYQFEYLRWVVRLVKGLDIPLDQARSFWATLDPPDAQAVCGSPEEVVDRLGEFAQAAGGVDIWLYQGDQGGLEQEVTLESLHLFAEEVVPKLI